MSVTGGRSLTSNTNVSEEIKLTSAGKILIRAFDELRITDPKIRKDAQEFIKRTYPSVFNSNDLWLEIMKAIVASCEANRYSFSKSELCDLLTIGSKGLDTVKDLGITNGGVEVANSRSVEDAILGIYKDIMENYDGSDDKLKSNYPRVVLNLSSIVHKGEDLSGERVGVYGLERYYQKSKKDATTKIPSITMPLQVESKYETIEPDSVPEKQQTEISRKLRSEIIPKARRKDLINSLSSLTQRKKRDIEELLGKISDQDYKKIGGLGLNHDKLQKYNKLAGSKEFSREIEKEIGRKLTERQLQHATISIRKVRSYIENVLDGKFVPHGSHGINHVKHNLEYGYQLMGLIEYKRRKR
jgi:hypothetical protein